MADATPAVSPLRRRMIDDMTLRNLSPATQRSYLHAVSKFSRYFNRSPERLGLEDVRAFQVYLVSQGISWPALNQTVCVCAFRRIRPPIPITSGHLFRSIRPPVTRCREAVGFGYQILGCSSSFLAMVFRMDAPSSSMRYAL